MVMILYISAPEVEIFNEWNIPDRNIDLLSRAV